MGELGPELIEQFGELLRSLIWPALILFLVVKFRHAISDFLRRLSEFNVKTPAGEFSAKAAEASALLGAAETAKGGAQNVELGEGAAEVQTLARGVEALARSRNLGDKSILWVDDDHRGNRYERKAFEALGIRVDAVASTEEALALLRRAKSLTRYDFAITDLMRGSDRSAGVEFIVAAREEAPRLPIIVYTGRAASPEAEEAKQAGADYVTKKPHELFAYAMSLL